MALSHLSHLALGVVSLHAALSTAQASRGAAAGFLLQALASTSMLLRGGGTDDNSLAGAWVATVIGLPLLAYDFHWVNGDCCSANLLLGTGMVLAMTDDHLEAEFRSAAGLAVMLVSSVTIVIMAAFMGSAYGMLGGLLLGAAAVLSRVEEDRVPWLPKEVVCRGFLLAGTWAYHRALLADRPQ